MNSLMKLHDPTKGSLPSIVSFDNEPSQGGFWPSVSWLLLNKEK